MFNEICLSDAVEFVVDNRGKTVPVQESGFPLIATNCINNDNLYPEFNNVRYVSDEVRGNWFRAHPEPNDIILTNKGSKNGAICLVPNPVSFCIAQDMVALRAKKGIVYPMYLFAALRSSLIQKRIKELNVDSVIPHFKKTDFNKLFFPLPDYDQQILIGDCFYKYCQKIELNRQTNQTLEHIAQAIFKSWFVDFEPTRAKISAKQEWAKRIAAAKESGNDTALLNEQTEATFIERAAMSAISGKTIEELNQLSSEQQEQLKTTAALFPDTLIDSEFGEAPQGWDFKTLSEIIEVIGGGTPKRSEKTYWNGDIPWFSVKDAPNLSDVFVVDTIEKISPLGLEKSSTKLLPVGTTIITARGTVGKLALVSTPMCMNQSCYGIKGRDGFGPYFNYFNLREAISTLQRNTHGAVFDTITTQTFESYSMPIAISHLIQKFEEFVSPLLGKIEKNNHESVTLSELRGSLLPKLLSGELTIASTQTHLEKAV